MSLSQEHESFLVEMEIEPARFEKLDRNAQILVEIVQDYETHKNDLLDVASYIANRLQRCEGVHTVRSRIKDTSHLVEKIIRKWECKEVAEKYHSITKDSYKSIIDDLVGVRAIYLFKKDWEVVHNHIVTKWEQQDKVKIYHRNGDNLTEYQDYKDCCAIQEHDKGYRSVHYIIPAIKIDGQQVNCEIQTRTIFEEGWSEIDHKVRYPSFSDNPYLQEFLDIFNRIAGSADEMGSFVNSLRELIVVNNLLEENKRLTVMVHESEINELEKKIDQLFNDKAELQEIQEAYNSLKHAQEQKNKIDEINPFDNYSIIQNQPRVTPIRTSWPQRKVKTIEFSQRMLDAVKATQQTLDAMKAPQQALDAMKAPQRALDAMKVTQQTLDAMKATQQTLDAMKAPQRALDAMKAPQRALDAMKAPQRELDTIKATQQTLDAIKKTK